MVKRVGQWVLRKWTLNREDLVFGGDAAACPVFAQHTPEPPTDFADVERLADLVPKRVALVPSDMSGWFALTEARDGDSVYTRVLAKGDEAMAELASYPVTDGPALEGRPVPVPFKKLNFCAASMEIERQLKTRDRDGQENLPTCVCEQLYGKRYLESDEVSVGLNHPSVWHSFPQTGATTMKNLEHRCPWVVFAYGCYDLCRPRSITLNKYRAGRGYNSILKYRVRVAGVPESELRRDGELDVGNYRKH
jgi:hypothetical protein